MSDDQRSLFEMEPDPWQLDQAAAELVARVVFTEGLTGQFDYAIPESMRVAVQPGQRLRVPLGRSNRLLEAFCVDVLNVDPAASKFRLKAVADVLDASPLISPEMLQLTRWMSDYYLASWGKVLEAVIPAGVRSGAGVRRVAMVRTTATAKTTDLRLPKMQAALLASLLGTPQPALQSDLLTQVGCTAAPLRSLQKKGLVEIDKVSRLHAPPSEVEDAEDAELAAIASSGDQVLQNSTDGPATPGVKTGSEPRLDLSASQQASVDSVVDCLKAGTHRSFVLHGVTGSGKTEVYIRAIEEVIRFRRQSIVLVPEISLTPQTRRRFRARFRNVAVLHSHLSDSERHWHWQRIREGKVEVIVGARSAIFAPTPHLGLIVLDEEHDGSFKQDSIPRYHAREVASQRAQMESIPLILGSATPSLETWQQTQTGAAELLSMPNRVLDRPLPGVLTIDLREDLLQRRKKGPISTRLDEAIRTALKRKQQVILLLNRRGFSTHIQCPSCGHVVSCPNCEMPLTHHREGEKAICHYCEYAINAPPVCPECRFEGIRYGGLGTQRLEDEVRKSYPKASVLRMDSDTMRKHGSHEVSLGMFRRGEVDILVGTQMIAKGLDFPNVTVVGVINADTGLHLPDFRAAERTFQLVTQVAGRTGRGVKGGCVYLQTYNPEHPAIRAAERHDYHRFAEQELPVRQQFGYPPFGAMIRIIVRGPRESDVEGFSDQIADLFDELAGTGGCRILGPAPAPIEKLRGNYRYHMILQSNDLQPIREVIVRAQAELKPPADVLWQADVDPSDML